MKKTNREIFDELSLEEHLKSVEAAAKIFRDMASFPDALGFDEQSGRFLVLHRHHAPSGFEYEIPVCVFLKINGFRVWVVVNGHLYQLDRLTIFKRQYRII